MQSSVDQMDSSSQFTGSDLLLYVLEFRAAGGVLARSAGIATESGQRLCDVLVRETTTGRTIENGMLQCSLRPEAIRSIINDSGNAGRALHSFFEAWQASGLDSMSCTLVFRTCRKTEKTAEHNAFTASLVLQLFNDGDLRASDIRTRSVLADVLETLPLRRLDGDGRFIGDDRESRVLMQMISENHVETLPVPAGVDRVQSLLSHRADQLLKDGNQIAPGAYVRDGVHIGRMNVVLSHTFIDTAVFIGDGNFINAHVSIGSGTQIGDNNRISPFASIEGVPGAVHARVAEIGSGNYIGPYSHLGAGVSIGADNHIGPGVVLTEFAKIKDCRARSLTKGEYLSGETLSLFFNSLAVTRNGAERMFNGVDVLPGEYVLFDNVPECMSRFNGDGTSRNGHQ